MPIDQSTSSQSVPPFRLGARDLRGLQGPLKVLVVNVIEGLDSLLEHLFSNVDDYFFDMANRAETSDHQATHFEAMRHIRVHRTTITDRFFSALVTAASNVWTARKPVRIEGESSGALNFDEVTILSDDEVEISAAKEAIASRGRARYGYELGSLTLTLNSVSPREPVNESTNPLGVNSITRFFADATGTLSSDIRVLLCLLKLFEREVADKLGDVYSNALAEIENIGVSVVKPEAKTPQRRTDRTHRDEVTVPDGVMEFAELQRCLAGAGPGDTPAFAGRDMGSQATAVAPLVKSLPLAQARYLAQLPTGESAGGPSFPNLRSFLLAVPTDEGGFQNAGRTELDTLKLISDLFEHIFRNPNVSLACKALIARLQLPILKIAIVDKSFFSRQDHPARQFLNRLAQDGIAWPSSRALLQKHRLYPAAESLVRQINDEFASDSKIFRRALDNWDELVARRRVQAESAERRINEAALGKAKLNAAKRIVERVLNQMAGLELPRAVASFITNQWSNVLVMICIKAGTDSREWKKALATCNDLWMACCARDVGEGAGSLEDRIPGLLARLSEGLELSGSAGSTDRDSIVAVETALRARVKQSSDPGDQFQDLEIMEPISLADDHGAQAIEEVDPRLKEFVPGTWIEIDRRPTERPLRCRLVVFADQTQTYVFANDDGLKVFERSVADMLQDLTSGRVKILAEEPLVERAMSDMVNDLRPDDADHHSSNSP